jgi:hypothetical protein
VDYASILERLAPCGLSGATCAAYTHGNIREHAERLRDLLIDFDRCAERFASFLPVFGKYPVSIR